MQARNFEAGTIAPGSSIKVWMPIVNELCKWCVSELHKNEERRTFLDEYILHIKSILQHVIKLTAENLPGMNKIISEFCMEEFEKMENSFREYDDRTYEIYLGQGENTGLV